MQIVQIMEKNLINEAIKKFEENTGLKTRFDNKAKASLYIKENRNNRSFDLEVRKTINKAAVILIAQQLSDRKTGTIVVTRYVSPPIADSLKALGVQFIDNAGNAYIHTPQIFVFLKGSKPSENPVQVSLNRAFKAKGLQVIFALLCNKGLEQQPLRSIADLSNVALGTVQWTVKDLEKLGFFVSVGKKNRELINKKELLNRWILAYNEQLRPKQFIGRFYNEKKDWWKTANIELQGGLWGGEVAGARLTRNLIPENITVYLHRPPGKLVIANKLKKDPNGNVELLNAFWKNNREFNGENLVHPVLTYADLVASGDGRNLEIANQIYEEEIVDLIREN